MSRTSPRIGLALGGGGARGLAHVHVLAALDDLGLVPAAIAGTSIGAIIGAGRAAGHDGAAVKEMISAAFRDRGEVWSKLWKLRPKRIADLFGTGLTQFDAELVLDLFVPEAIPASFDDLVLPLSVVATDFYGCAEKVLISGELRRAVAASIALPIVFRPVIIDEVVLIDGGVVNPVPYDRMPAPVDLVVAVDVVGEPVRPHGRSHPNATESVFGASQILMQSVFTEKVRQKRPDVIIRPPVDHFAVLDFLKASAIIRSTHEVREVVKRQLGEALEAHVRA